MELVDTPKLQEQQQENFHVLVVDDSVIDRKLLERLLRDSSCKATFVDSGDKALKYLGLLDGLDNASSTSSESFQQDGIKVNLIMTDYCMPGMSGYDLLKRIKLQGSSWKDVPVVIMSSENVPSRISMCLEGGAEEFLLKPLQLSDLKKPYFLKSLDNSSEQENDNSSLASNNDNNNNSNKNNNVNERKSIFQRHGFKFQSPTKIVAAILQFWKSP